MPEKENKEENVCELEIPGQTIQLETKIKEFSIHKKGT